MMSYADGNNNQDAFFTKKDFTALHVVVGIVLGFFAAKLSKK